jgi:succinate dehydrogenase flavin-adding protein (antitoxin of CptAB toxin-antitoxin module)
VERDVKRRRRTVYIGNQRWKVEWDCRLRGLDGLCDYERKTIKLRRGMNVADLVDTIVHELIHARWPDLHEDAVADFAETLSGFLDASGLLMPDHHAPEE